MYYYKIVDERNGLPATLFHGINGSRNIPLNEWIGATRKLVNDGSGPLYWSGFHILCSKKDAISYLDRFINTEPKRIVRVLVNEHAGIWPKKHSKSNIFLCQEIMITEKDWNKRLYYNKNVKTKN